MERLSYAVAAAAAAALLPLLTENWFKLIPNFLAVAWTPSFLMVFNVRVLILNLTVLFPSSQKNFRVCRFTCWTLCVWALDLLTFMHLEFCLVPDRSHFLSRITNEFLCNGKKRRVMRGEWQEN